MPRLACITGTSFFFFLYRANANVRKFYLISSNYCEKGAENRDDTKVVENRVNFPVSSLYLFLIFYAGYLRYRLSFNLSSSFLKKKRRKRKAIETRYLRQRAKKPRDVHVREACLEFQWEPLRKTFGLCDEVTGVV